MLEMFFVVLLNFFVELFYCYVGACVFSQLLLNLLCLLFVLLHLGCCLLVYEH